MFIVVACFLIAPMVNMFGKAVICLREDIGPVSKALAYNAEFELNFICFDNFNRLEKQFGIFVMLPSRGP